MLETSVDDLEIAGGRVAVKGVPTTGIDVGDLARAAGGLAGFKLPAGSVGRGIEATEAVIIDDMVYSNGSAVAEVEVGESQYAVA